MLLMQLSSCFRLDTACVWMGELVHKIKKHKTQQSHMTRIKIKDFEVEVLAEDDGSYSIACSELGVYGVGKTLSEAKNDFLTVLDLHLDVLRRQAVNALQVRV
ncbi:TPA: hypothetical protein HA316_02780 [Candidatus Micrarchaeota archaeon]|nr:hypothetical protein [Candidatus Micrarchaeota archaeon]